MTGRPTGFRFLKDVTAPPSPVPLPHFLHPKKVNVMRAAREEGGGAGEGGCQQWPQLKALGAGNF